jgi:CRP-like cAMP-binding protein
LMSVKSRLAVSLLSLSEQFGINEAGYINLDLSRQDLAAYAGATYETVFRTMNDMVAADLITLEGKKIRVDSAKGLQKLASE